MKFRIFRYTLVVYAMTVVSLQASTQPLDVRLETHQILATPLQPQFKRVLPDATNTKRTILFSVSTCLSSGGSSPMASQKLSDVPVDVYRILYTDSGTQHGIIKLNNILNGGQPYHTQSGEPCFRWLDTIEHEYQGVLEGYFKYVYDIRLAGSAAPTFEQAKDVGIRRTVLINPCDWQSFGKDLAEFGPESAVDEMNKSSKKYCGQ